jgi:hypothetical protein
MFALGTQVFADDNEVGALANGNTKESGIIYGQHKYGMLRMVYISGDFDVVVRIQELTSSNSWKDIYANHVNASNPKVDIPYYLVGGKAYKLIVQSAGAGGAYLTNYLP